jgi:hypothetical protein
MHTLRPIACCPRSEDSTTSDETAVTQASLLTEELAYDSNDLIPS